MDDVSFSFSDKIHCLQTNYSHTNCNVWCGGGDDIYQVVFIQLVFGV